MTHNPFAGPSWSQLFITAGGRGMVIFLQPFTLVGVMLLPNHQEPEPMDISESTDPEELMDVDQVSSSSLTETTGGPPPPKKRVMAQASTSNNQRMPSPEYGSPLSTLGGSNPRLRRHMRTGKRMRFRPY